MIRKDTVPMISTKLYLGFTFLLGSTVCFAQTNTDLTTPIDCHAISSVANDTDSTQALFTIIPDSVVVYDQDSSGGFIDDTSLLSSSGGSQSIGIAETNPLLPSNHVSGFQLSGAIGSGNQAIQSIEAPVPEPSSIAVVSLAILGFLARKKKR
jgi:hypothetical protein